MCYLMQTKVNLMQALDVGCQWAKEDIKLKLVIHILFSSNFKRVNYMGISKGKAYSKFIARKLHNKNLLSWMFNWDLMGETLNRDLSTLSDQMCLWGYRIKLGDFQVLGNKIDLMNVNRSLESERLLSRVWYTDNSDSILHA